VAFKKAVKTSAKLRLAIAGPSGSGKTYTALRVACALVPGGKVAVLDTEHGSASKYADLFDFDADNLEPPFHPNRYAAAIADAGKAGYDVLILDSISHAWMGKGGLLEEVDKVVARQRTANSYTAWKDITPIHQAFIEAILQAPMHIIATMRSKQDYVLETDDKGKTRPKKVGMAPVQRDGMEYEFDVVLEMDAQNRGIVAKTRCPALAGEVLDKPGEDLASTLREWLTGAAPPSRPEQVPTQAAPASASSASAAGGNGNGSGNGKSLTEKRTALEKTLQGIGLNIDDAISLVGGVELISWSDDEWTQVRDACKKVLSAKVEDRKPLSPWTAPTSPARLSRWGTCTAALLGDCFGCAATTSHGPWWSHGTVANRSAVRGPRTTSASGARRRLSGSIRSATRRSWPTCGPACPSSGSSRCRPPGGREMTAWRPLLGHGRGQPWFARLITTCCSWWARGWRWTSARRIRSPSRRSSSARV